MGPLSSPFHDVLLKRSIWRPGPRYSKSRGGSRGTSNNCVGEQKSNYLLRKTKLKAIFALLHRCLTYLKSTSEILVKL